MVKIFHLLIYNEIFLKNQKYHTCPSNHFFRLDQSYRASPTFGLTSTATRGKCEGIISSNESTMCLYLCSGDDQFCSSGTSGMYRSCWYFSFLLTILKIESLLCGIYS